jgi:transcriptional antiterminator RfaH
MPNSLSSCWFLAYAKPRQEVVACDNLVNQGFEVYFPKIKVIKRGVDDPVTEPMFPRYVFFRPTQSNQDVGKVRYTRGVTNLVRFGFELAQLSSDQLERIQALETQNQNATLDDLSPLAAGVRVQIVSGVVAGLEGLVSRVAGKRVSVLLQLMGRSVELDLSHSDLALA